MDDADPQVEELARLILGLLAQREAGRSICPSEAARAAAPASADDAAWRDLMEPAREAARLLVSRGQVVVTQGGEVVDAGTARGPIRIRLA